MMTDPVSPQTIGAIHRLISREQIVAHAREWLGTRWHHQGRLRGVGGDCIAPILSCAYRFGLYFQDRFNYSRVGQGELERELKRQCRRVRPGDVWPGDIALFWIRPRRRVGHHVAIVTDRGLLHALYEAGRVVEHGFSGKWPSQLMGVYRFRLDPGNDAECLAAWPRAEQFTQSRTGRAWHQSL